MPYALNFNTIKKETFKLTLPDKDQTVINLLPPTKNMINKFLMMDKALKNETNQDKQMSDVYEIIAELMSINVEKKTFTGKQIEKMLEIEHIMAFFTEYTKFIKGIKNQKN